MPKPTLNVVKASKEQIEAFALTEDSLATSMASNYEGRLKFAHKFKRWFIYESHVGIWKHDTTELVLHLIREFVRNLNTDAREKWASAKVVNSVESFVKRDPVIACGGEEFDADPWLIGTPSGVLDLHTGTILDNSPSYHVSKRTAVSPEKREPTLWLNFLEQATGSNKELIGYLQRLSGYCLTGETKEEVLTFLYGLGGNGKGVFTNTLSACLGEYARQAPMQILLASKGDRHPTEVASLHGARLVLASESPEGRSWDEERVKSITGRDVISARFMHRDFFEFTPCFKLLVASNHKPRIKTVDDAWRRRIHLVPFTRKPDRPDPNLKDKLRAEYPAILQWMIEGAEWWEREGLTPPAAITDATDEYFREEDVLGLWFAEKCDRNNAGNSTPFTGSTTRADLYRSYEAYCKGMGHAAKTMHAMTRWFAHNGFQQHATHKMRPVLGVRLKSLEEMGAE